MGGRSAAGVAALAGEVILAHSDVLKKVLPVLGGAVVGNFSGYYKASNGK
jgi:hypothetical protein